MAFQQNPKHLCDCTIYILFCILSDVIAFVIKRLKGSWLVTSQTFSMLRWQIYDRQFRADDIKYLLLNNGPKRAYGRNRWASISKTSASPESMITWNSSCAHEDLETLAKCNGKWEIIRYLKDKYQYQFRRKFICQENMFKVFVLNASSITGLFKEIHRSTIYIYI